VFSSARSAVPAPFPQLLSTLTFLPPQAQLIPDSDTKLKDHALTRITDHPIGASPSRWADSRLPNPTELKSTRVLSFKIDYASAKIRTGDPKDDKKDIDANLPYWTGRVERKKGWEKVVKSPYCDESTPGPPYVKDMLQRDS
jgi:uncharacterized protein